MFIRPADRAWGGVQLRSGRFRFVQLAHQRTGNTPLHGFGYITLESAHGRTPSVAATLARLRATPHLAAGRVRAARIGGYSGKAFDANVTARDTPPVCKRIKCAAPGGISLTPFTVNRHCGPCKQTMHYETLDVKFAGNGQLLQISVLDVRRPTEVPAREDVPDVLPYARRMFSRIRFPR